MQGHDAALGEFGVHEAASGFERGNLSYGVAPGLRSSRAVGALLDLVAVPPQRIALWEKDGGKSGHWRRPEA